MIRAEIDRIRQIQLTLANLAISITCIPLESAVGQERRAAACCSLRCAWDDLQTILDTEDEES